MHWGESLEYPTAEKKPWVQILHDNDNHWFMAASGYGEKDSILIYDSLRNAVEPCRHIIYSAALICPSKKDELQLEMMNTQIQSDGSSCGLFAIANATALAFGLNPSEYVYDATQLREHFIKCCSEKKMEPFPFIDMRRCRNWRSSRRYRYKLFCSCKMPFDDQDEGFPEKYRKLVECKGCKNWFHVSCEMIPNDVLTERRSSWRCSKCVQQ